MLTFFRHLLAILVAPLLVVVLIPEWLRSAFPGSGWAFAGALGWLPRILGVLIIGGGFTLFAWCVVLFIRFGRGTIMPWDPTRSLIGSGPYRYVRNPMISGVVLMLFGQALLRGSWAVGMWGITFLLINHAYFIFSEEPGLEKRFGEPYRRYKQTVPRWLPVVRRDP